jgi:hypothetical protein
LPADRGLGTEAYELMEPMDESPGSDACYLIFFSPAEGVAEDISLPKVREFMDAQVASNGATGYRIVRMTNKATFPELPDYAVFVDYATQDDLNAAFREMGKSYREGVHAELMGMVRDFRVAFGRGADRYWDIG